MSETAVPLEPPGGEVQELFPAGERAPAEAGTHISRLVVEGFGALSGLEVGDLGAGLNVLLGPNEAGKSTLFDFVATMLFGFPARRNDEHFHEPVRGGRHGGRLMLTDRSGSEWSIERIGPPKKSFSLRRPDGSLGDGLDLRQLLAGANGELFRAVFAVDLDDLRQLEGMSSDEVREVLFSSSVLGQRHSTAQALKELDAARDELVRPRQGGRANTLAGELRQLKAELTTARLAARGFPSMQAELEAHTRQREEIEQAQERARRRAGELERLLNCWEVMGSRTRLEGDLAGLAPLSEQEDRLLSSRARLHSLASQLSGHSERLVLFREERARRLSLRKSVEDKAAVLGGESALEAVGHPSFDGEALAEELADLRDAFGRAEEAVSHSEQAVARERSATILPPSEKLPPSAELDARLAAFRELQGWMAEQQSAERQLEQQALLARSGAAGSLPRGLTNLLFGISALLVLAGGITASRHELALGLFILVLGIGLGAVLLLAGRRTGLGSRAITGLKASREDAAASSERARQEVSRLAGALGLSIPVSAVELQKALGTTEGQRDERRRLEQEAEKSAEAAERLAIAERALSQANAQLSGARLALAEFGRRLGVESCAVDQLTDVVRKLTVLQDRHEALQRIDDKLAESSGAIERFEADLIEFLSPLSLVEQVVTGEDGHLETDSIERVLLELEAAAAELAARLAQRDQLARDLQAAEDELQRLLGQGERASHLRQELATGHVVEWQEEAESARGALFELQQERDELVRAEERLSSQMDALSSSDTVPELERRVLEIEEELRQTISEFLVASGARLLLQETLKRYERERQPRVIELASRHFGRVTEGRYVRLRIDSAPDGSKPRIEVFGPEGTALDAGSLSRGAMEQLYLCIRLGLAESFAEGYLPLPIVLDDVLVNADPDRRKNMARALADTASRHQVLFLTCHPEVAELLEQTAGQGRTRLHLLPRL